MPMKKDKVKKILLGKGFVLVKDQKNRDHDFLYLRDPQNPNLYYPQVRTKLSRGSKYKTLSDDLLSKMARELYFDSKKEFMEYLECTKTHRQHVEKLRNNEII